MKQYARITGRHVYLAELLDAIQEAQGEDVCVSRAVRQRVMAEHGHLYGQLDAHQKVQYNQAAQALARLRQESACNDREALLQDLAARQVTTQPQLIDGISHLLLTNSSFSTKHLEVMSTMLSSPEFQGAALSKRRQEATRPLQLPPPVYQDLMNKIVIPVQAKPEAPAWAKLVSSNRDCFAHCVLHFRLGEEAIMGLFLYAMQKPFHVAMVQVQALPSHGPDYTRNLSVLDAVRLADQYAGQRYQVLMDKYIFSSDPRLADPEAMFVHPEARMDAGLVLNTLADLVPFERYVLNPLPQTAEPSTGRTSAKHCFSEEDLTNYPWLQQYAQRGHTGATSSMPHDAQPRQLPEDPDADVQDLLAEAVERLKAKRWARSVDAPEDSEHYVIKVRGGRWTQFFRSVPADSVMALAKSAEALDFSHKFSLSKMATFAFGVYGEHGADRLAQLWVSRMQQLMIASLEHPDVRMLSDLGVQVVEPEWVAGFVEANAENSRLLRRVAEIRAIG